MQLQQIQYSMLHRFGRKNTFRLSKVQCSFILKKLCKFERLILDSLQRLLSVPWCGKILESVPLRYVVLNS